MSMSDPAADPFDPIYTETDERDAFTDNDPPEYDPIEDGPWEDDAAVESAEEYRRRTAEEN